MTERPRTSSVGDFSDQWVHYTQQAGHYASEAMLADYLGPLLDLRALAGTDVCEIGCGNGRFLRHFAAYAKYVTGIEPSNAYRNSIEYNRSLPNVRVIHSDVYDLTIENAFDYVFCLGVLHQGRSTDRRGPRLIAVVRGPGMGNDQAGHGSTSSCRGGAAWTCACRGPTPSRSSGGWPTCSAAASRT